MTKRKASGHATTFSELVKREQAKGGTDPLDNRSRSRVAERDLWDDEGLHWSLESEVSVSDADSLIADPSVKFGAAWAGARRLEWFTEGERTNRWLSQFRPATRPSTQGVVEPDELSYYPQLWRRRDGSRLLLIQTLC